MAISEKEYLILSDLAYDNLISEGRLLSDIYFDENGKLRSSMMDKKNVDSKTDSALGINRYAGDELKTGFQGVLESEDYKNVMKNWKVIAVSNEQENSGYYGVAFEYVGDGENKGKIVLANRGTEPFGEQKKKDLVITDGQIFSSYYPNQFEDAMKFYNQVKGLSIANGKMINVTGHSLGGGISQYIGVMGDNVGEVVTWNGVGIANQKKIDQYDFWGLSKGPNYIYEKLVRLNYIDNNQVTENFKFELNNIFDDVSNVF